MIFSATLKNHVRYLRAIFELFIKYNIVINSKKTFIDYFFVKLLSQKINSLDLFTDEEKFKVIISLQFSYTLASLEYYLKLIE